MTARLLRVACLARIACLLLLGLVLAPAGQAAPALGDEGRVGVVADRQGLCFVRPAGRTRWTPLAPRAQVYPGDRIRTEGRGANALELRLAGGARLVLGPGALLDVLGPQRLELLEGEAEATGSEQAPLVVALAGAQQELRAVAWLAAREGRLSTLSSQPRWLAGWRAGTSDEWMGSLLVDVDGKQVPLHVGWHKVDVEVRDQVARTTVEQAFVNDTDQRLEGVFRFPLPAEASISGFGMWIGGELVEADVVERERARQVYEDILRRKKDPGLLEWAGGNVFQARVFPIEPRSEKRVRLRYTEVLPLEGGAWHYRYALQGELMRQHPLRELQVNVRVTSTQALAGVTCPTHPDARVSAGAHEASVELSRRDTTPTSDLEVVGTVAPGAGVTPIAHCRDGEGWFMLLVRPPEPAEVPGARALVPEGTPLDLIVAVDTSGSLAGPARAAQDEFLATLLGLLGPGDRVRLCTLDTQVRWLAGQPEGASPGLASRARAFVEQRPPRGWSDLDSALEVLLGAAGAGTQVIYLGDGIPTRGDGDAVALAQRIRAAGARTQATFHAVVPGSAYERGVLEALASLGGGSVRHLREEAGHAAERLLEEMAQPGLKDLRVEVRGVPVARVYPARLPNLPAGGQHVVVGRLQPGAARTAQVAVSGTYQGQPVRLEAALEVPAPGEGNSFLPRLWAQRHVSALLEQGATPAVRQQVIEASIEHTLLTSYTSLLVLESDEDRERYGIERRVKARDGEVEFAATRDVAALEASRRALEQAQGWRLRLKRRMLQEIAGLGRDLPLPVPEVALVEWLDMQAADATPVANDLERAKGEESGLEGFVPAKGGLQHGGMPGAPPRAPAASAPAALREERKALDLDGSGGGAPGEPPGESDFNETADGDDLDEEADSLSDEAEEESLATRAKQQESLEKAVAGKSKKANSLRRSLEPASAAYAGEADVGLALPWEVLREGTLRARPDATLLGFPARGASAWEAPPPPEAPQAEPAAREWLARLLAPGEATAHLRLLTQVERLRARDGRVTSREELLVWRAAAEAWTRRTSAGEPALEHSLEAGRLTRLDAGSRLGRAWEAGPHAALTLDDLAQALGLPTARSLEGAVVSLAGPGTDDRVELVVARPPSEARTLLRLRRTDGALLALRRESPGELPSERRYSQHVALAGRLWPLAVEQLDGRGRVQWRLAAQVEAVTPEAWSSAVQALRAGASDAIVLGPEAPTLREARERLARGTAGLEERVVLLLDRLAASRPEEAVAHLEAALAGQPAVPAAWLRAALHAHQRDAAALAAHLEAVLRPLVEAAPAGRRGLAERLLSFAGARLGPSPTLALLQALAPRVLADEAADPWGAHAWSWREVDLLRAAGRADEARARTAALAASRPDDLDAQLAQAAALRQQGEPDQALAHLGSVLAATPWLGHERDRLVDEQVDLLGERQRDADLEALLAQACTAPEAPARRWVQWQSMRYRRGAQDEADLWVRNTLSGAARGVQSTPEERAPLSAALELARGQGYGFWSQAFAPLFAEALLEAVRFHGLQDDARRGLALEALGDWKVSGLSAAEAVRAQLRAEATQPATLAGWPVPRLEALLFLVGWQADDTAEDLFQRVLAGLEARRAAAPSAGERDAVAGLMVRIAGERGDRNAVLAVARRQREAAQGRARPAAAQALLDALLESPHTAVLEDEALALVVDLAASDEPPARCEGRAARDLRRWVAWALPARAEALLGTPAERAARTRAAARVAAREARSAAREALASRLVALQGPGPLLAWARLEALALRSENRSDLAAVVAGALETLSDAAWESLPPGHPQSALARTRTARAALLLAHAATRRGAEPVLADQALAAFEARWTRSSHDWRYESVRLWLALDRLSDLLAALSRWAGEDELDVRWRRLQGWLEAELGRPAEAARAWQALAGIEGALSAQDWTTLATWRLVAGDRAGREAALRASFEAMGEWELRQWLQEQRRVSGPGGVPGDLPPEAWTALEVLMAKAQWPGQHLWVLQWLYRETKDHRALAALAPAVAGHALEPTFGLLGSVGQLLDEVHEEATLDALRTALEQRLAAQPAPSSDDQRALHLLLARCEARAARVVQQDRRHAERAQAALQRGVEGTPPAARRALAGWLSALRPGEAPALKEARDAALQGLLQAAEVASGDHLAVARALAGVQAAEKRLEAALDTLAAALARSAAVDGAGDLAAQQAEARRQRVRWLAELGRYAQAEQEVDEALAQAGSQAERERWRTALPGLWGHALARGGSTRLGTGAALYRAALERTEQAWRELPVRTREWHNLHVGLSDAALKGKVQAALGEDRLRFARERLPSLYAGRPGDVTNMAEAEASCLERVAGPRDALGWMLERMDAEPSFFGRVGEDLWGEAEGEVAQRRAKAGALGALEARLLARARRVLEQRVLAENGRVSPLWSADHEGCWHARLDDLQAAVLAGAEQRPGSAGVQRVAARHLRAMRRLAPAIALLEGALQRDVLPPDGQRELLGLLVEAGRAAPALALAERLLAATPEAGDLHVLRARMLVQLGRAGEAEAALRTGLEHAARDAQPTPALLGGWGVAASQAGQHALAVEWLQAALKADQPAGRERGSYAAWRRALALSLSALGRVDEAVDVAALVALAERRAVQPDLAVLDAEAMPEAVLLKAPDLPGYAARLAQRVAASGADVPVVRKALARVFLSRKDSVRALQQLEALREVVPDDPAVLRALVALYDGASRPAEALAALDALAVLSPGDAATWESLGRRLAAQGDGDGATRALTQPVELRPLEPDGHRLLARLAAERRQHAEAAAHWQSVTRVRPLEPEGRLEEARAWLAAGEPQRARTPLEEVLAGSWEERFGDVKAEAGRLLAEAAKAPAGR